MEDNKKDVMEEIEYRFRVLAKTSTHDLIKKDIIFKFNDLLKDMFSVCFDFYTYKKIDGGK